MRLNENEKKVLEFLVDQRDHEFCYCGFDVIAQHTKLERPIIRRACRSLKRKGLTEFLSGLWTDDGEPAGSGYAATKSARQLMAS